MAKGAYIGTEKIITVTNLLDYNTLSNNNGGYWGKWNLSGQTDYVNWGSGLYPPGGQRSGRFNKNITSGLAEATYQLAVQSGSIKVNLNSSHLYYFSIYLYQPSIVGSFACYWPIAEPPAVSNFTVSQINTWERHSAIFNRNSFSNGSYEVRFDFDNPTNNSTLYFGNVALVDLTATFGAGFEPDKEWCDKNINFLDSSSTLASETATITVNYSVARKVKKMYVGVNNVAHKVIKGYIGIGGIARPFFTSGATYYGQITPLSVARGEGAATSNANYALFGGGYGTAYSNVVDAYNSSLVRQTATSLSSPTYKPAATYIGQYALIGGGLIDRGSGYTNIVNAYNNSLTKSTKTLNNYVGTLAATSNSNYALFGGGYGGSSLFNYQSAVSAYNSSLGLTTRSLGVARELLAATSVGDYAIFGGGYKSGGYSNNTDAFDQSLTRTTPTSLSVARAYLTATTVNNYGLFAGGNSSTYYNTIDIYDSNLIRTTPITLSVAKSKISSTTLGEYALFSGGATSSSSTTNIVDIFDTSLTRTTIIPSSDVGMNSFAATIGNYALIAGYRNSSTVSNDVDAYTIS